MSAAAGVHVRAPQPADTAGMLALVAACNESDRAWAPPGWRPPPAGSAYWVTELAAADRWTRVAVAAQADAEEGVVGLVSWSAARDGARPAPIAGVAELTALFVHPSHWRRGIATGLLDAAVESMRAAGYRRARLTTLAGAPAESFYRARGWSRDGRDAFHHLMGLPAVGYSREL